MALPPFWILFLAIIVTCIALCTCEDLIYGPQKRGDEANWARRYRFMMEYIVRIVFLAITCLLFQIVAWIVGTIQ
ncbi:hypothetical protein [Rhizobium rhizogenes]|uniref:hypothetical protein n=1 Tax=Rhizobium rhizogenes TaxID=359 RepID=UPI001AEE0395|nr:hypothetical protein [Rhizobium rhizogenes]